MAARELARAGSNIKITLDGQDAGELFYSARAGKAVLQPDSVVCEGDNVAEATFKDADLRDEFTYTDGLIKIKRRWKITKPGKWQLIFGYSPSPKLRQWIVPSVMYDENRMGTGKYPTGGLERGWSFREDRIPIPSCSILHDGSTWQAVFTTPAHNEGEISSVKTFLCEGRPSFEIRVPFTEEPFTYTEKGIIIGGLSAKTGKLFNIRKIPFEYTRTFYIATGTCSHVSEIYTALTAVALNEFGTGDKRPDADWSGIARLKLQHLKYLLIDNEKMTAIKMGRGNGLFQSFYEFTAGSFLVRGLEGATIFARTAKEVDNAEYMETAGKIGNFFLAGALPNGLHRDCSRSRTAGGAGISAWARRPNCRAGPTRGATANACPTT
jgi:hypothetical protein